MCNYREVHNNKPNSLEFSGAPKHEKVSEMVERLKSKNGKELYNELLDLPYPQKIQVMKSLNM